MSDIVEVKDFQIKNLQNQLADAKKQIEILSTRLDNTVYFSVLACDLFEKSRRAIQSAARGEIEKPVLRLNSDI